MPSTSTAPSIFAQLNHFGVNAIERLRRRLPRPLGPVRRQVARLRRDAEGDGARGHPRGVEWWARSRRGVARGRLRRHRGAHLAQLPAASVPLAALQQARRRVRRLVREPAPLRARGDRRRCAGASATTGSSACASASPTSFPARSTSTTRCAVAQAARGRRADRLRQRDRRRATTTSSGRSSPRTSPDGYLVDLTARVKAAVDAAGVHGRRDQGRGARRGDPGRRARRTWSR